MMDVPTEHEPQHLNGWHVVEVGRRQAWPFMGFADPESGMEVRLYIDSTFKISGRRSALRQHDDAAVKALESLSGLTVRSVESSPAQLNIQFDETTLSIEQEANELTSGSPWYFGQTV